MATYLRAVVVGMVVWIPLLQPLAAVVPRLLLLLLLFLRLSEVASPVPSFLVFLLFVVVYWAMKVVVVVAVAEVLFP